jgi:CubicO group peptidase (beta-lactamase class C family)
MTRFTRQLLVWLLMTFAFSPAFAQTPVPSVGQSLPGLEAFDEAMQAIMANHKYPGGTLAVAFQGRMVLNKAYGVAKKSFNSSTPMAADQRMRIASMSKLITAVAALKVAEQGKLDLDKPFVETMGYSTIGMDYADSRITKVTLRQLLQNHAGWTIDRNQDPVFDRMPPCPYRSARWLSTMKLDAEPGQLWSYSNISFCFAQQAIEKATGRKYEDYVKAEIAEPFGIKSWEFATLRGKPDEPDYISQVGDRGSDENINFEAIGGAGAWTSTAADYVRFWTALRGYKGQALLKPASFAQLHGRPQAAASVTSPLFYGLGVRARILENGSHNLWHTGSLPGTSSFGVSFASGWSIVAIFNSRVPQAARDQAVSETDRLLNQAARKSKPPEGELLP